MFAILALVAFVLATFNVHLGDLNVVALGLCFLAVHMLVGNWPLGAIQLTRRN